MNQPTTETKINIVEENLNYLINNNEFWKFSSSYDQEKSHFLSNKCFERNIVKVIDSYKETIEKKQEEILKNLNSFEDKETTTELKDSIRDELIKTAEIELNLSATYKYLHLISNELLEEKHDYANIRNNVIKNSEALLEHFKATVNL
jgi:Mg/Co/Ni transporter MgtE